MGVPWAHLERVLAELWGHVGCAQAANSQSGHAPAKKRRDLCARVVKLVVVALALALAVVVPLPYCCWIPFEDHPLKLERYRED